MNKKSLFDATFGRYIAISEDAYSFLDDHFQLKKYTTKEMIVEGGGLARYFYLVISGVQCIYRLNEKGEKVVLGFSYSGNISGVYDSFLSEKPSELFLEALSPTEMIGITKQGYLELFEQFPEFYKWRTYFIESILFGRMSREVEVMSSTAKERFDAFTQRCPPELLQIPQKYLASYLNMTPETFSRLRALRD
ncbi:Crp/Fnr family transcriptional regulator [Ekhidna sp.]|uniref:Crp/Fnr family transcriptional regulator n=1 Tax=Ekhidna sp. TaxID=2608089 RepID=UPI00329A3D0F